MPWWWPWGDAGEPMWKKTLDEALENGDTKLSFGNRMCAGDDGAREIAAALRSNTTLQELNLSENNIGAAGAREIAAALRSNATLKKLDLRYNHIGDDGAREIAAALRSNTTRTLEALYLVDNHIGADGAREIAAAVRVNTTLNDLWLAFNYIGDDGAREIAAALCSNTTLEKLSLGGNNIGDEGAREIAAALRSNTALKELSLHWNNIGDDGAREISAALRSNTALEWLDLYGNGIGDDGAREIATVLRGCSNTTLKEIDLSEGVGMRSDLVLQIRAYVLLNADPKFRGWGNSAMLLACNAGCTTAVCALLLRGARLAMVNKRLLVSRVGEVPVDVLDVEREVAKENRLRMASDRRAALWGVLA